MNRIKMQGDRNMYNAVLSHLDNASLHHLYVVKRPSGRSLDLGTSAMLSLRACLPSSADGHAHDYSFAIQMQ